jgi:hypothetical protein
MAPSLSAVVEFRNREKAFADQCGATPPHVSGGSADDYTAQLFDKVSKCIELSGLGVSELFRARIADLSDSLSKAISNRSSGVDYLTFTTGELHDGKRVAFLALFFAFAVDALVLVFTFLGELPRSKQSQAPVAMPLTDAERHRMFTDLQFVNDALDTSDPARYPLARTVLTCLQAGSADGLSRLDLSKLTQEPDRQTLRRRLLPFLTSGLAWNETNDLVSLSERGMSMLIQECRRVMAVEEPEPVSDPEPLKPTLADHLRRAG